MLTFTDYPVKFWGEPIRLRFRGRAGVNDVARLRLLAGTIIELAVCAGGLIPPPTPRRW